MPKPGKRAKPARAEAPLGAKLRTLRLARDVSITRLAKLTGLTPSFISQVERGLANLSITSLREICRALGVPMFQVFLDHDEPRLVVRRGERRTISLPGSQVTYQLLSPLGIERKLEMILISLEPGGSTSDRQIGHAEEEGLFVLQGAAVVELGDETYRLEQGDSMYFQSSIPHRYVNAAPGTTVLLAAITPPSY